MIVKTILTALAAYIATAVDYFIIMLIFFSAEKTKNKMAGFVIGHYLGMFTLYAISLGAAYGVGFIPEQWIIGLLGFVPIALGLKVLFQKEAEDNGKTEILRRTQKMNGLVLGVIFLTLATGGDDLGVFIPLFASYSVTEIIVTLSSFVIFIGLLCLISHRLAKFRGIGAKIEKYEKLIAPIVFIGIGIMVLWENGTISAFLNLFA